MPRSVRRRRTLTVSLLGGSLILSGCGMLRPETADRDDGPLTLGFVNGGTSPFHTCLEAAVDDTARNNLAELHIANSRQDAATELANIEDMIARQVDAIIVQTVDVDALRDDIAKARSADVPVFLTSVVPEDTADLLGAVVVDLEHVGRLDAGWIEKDAAGKEVQVGIVAGAPGAASDLLVGGFESALPAGAEVVANQPGMFDPGKARKVAEQMIQDHPDLDYAFVANEEMAFAVREAFDSAGADTVRIVTVNGTDEGLAALKDGRFAATVANSAADTGELAVTNTIGLLRDWDADRIAHTPVRLVTKSNADTAPLYCPPNAG
ncbi:sugar ABC transporter substrate-binding protein [Streptomyces cinnabarinus]|uniref:Sugar ABC transporter substrate-binding protein n=1 Tax=Streptomyces cinnabarinus TaxID=67287 RepID=A0ABY7KNR2_9ACTN|nr:sugar ABC transporter substrate-binding protein [Streptomyces cinnabarinus]WAZ24529.1 sugar ABC transporter substrate-binding protein [Streptomyces cinnabarinus]